MRKLRTKLGYTQEILGERIGVEQSYISRLENGEIEFMTIGKLKKLSRALQITPVKLLEILLKEERKKKNGCL
ncbi:XRE family transcriptional regulator [Clostridium botulinum]|uniref:helix-turn-helix domain-containing protein n=1 Tax=Clostridium botulinum TaxID=1491 RepID=UPI0006A6A6BC|nr:helix-turn-helix transcriptional regulator [Clostridium botulinum]KOM97231.1 XRE family transcriptional regulator [Clostridium botulinum]KON00734.1 XRE family transcriptional regulator [Clostridium botulinum]MBY6799484.1 helix-turn-helix transcriptional regulator [Clostridium botulinum]MBY7003506.1 helix-turn-helix transcriptional regulator [Clostridium botulinum]MCR1146020.1 helix-turn-helix transcriptional regulator [Clostridium botulinum]